MAETISHTWQTVEQAAVTMNCSTRTVARRLANGSLESRVDENGRRLVLVQQLHPADDDAQTPTGTFDTTELAHAAEPEAVTLRDSALGGEPAMTVLTVLQTTLTAARDDATAARRSAKWAWAGVAFMAVALLGGTALLSGVLTKAAVTQGLLGTQLAETRSELKQTQAELMATRSGQAVATSKVAELQAAADAQRRTELARPTAPTITGVTNAAKPTTRPSLIDRVASLLGAGD